MQFSPCRGGMNCTQDGTQCEGCGRSHAEIAETKQIAEAIADYALRKDFDNFEEFLQFVAFKAFNKIRLARMEVEGGLEVPGS